ncbi:S9 family peptidase [Nocardioides sp. SYSU D00038]|uniref:alpha/beta hydrolase family protein n=1 Tax=Nocardioides sp. SYSU D00038 TaxID=2812554 RepID=UPI0019678A82|nr:alpha/beta fold hydrolase [Nocardioides sp. SYSU D00038]
MRRLLTAVLPTLVLVLPLAACSGDDEPGAAPEASVSTSPSPPAGASEATPEVTPEAPPADSIADEPALPEVRHPVSLPALMRQEPRGGRLRVLRTLERTPAYTRQEVSYRSDRLRVTGQLLRPRGRGPFPGIVLNHGYIEPSIYVNGQGLAREQVALATAGFVVLHTDYRGHAGSSPVPELDRETRLGYTRDAVNAVATLESLPYVDDDRLAMLGRSMGGGVTMNALVTQPGLVDAAVVYASVSSRFLDNVRHFSERGRPETVAAFVDRFGSPEERPGFYRDLSPRTFFDRITEPVLALHGEVDATCPPRWARETQRLMRAAGVDSRLRFYEGEDHAFYDRWQDSMDLTIRFLRRQFRAAA